MSFDNAKSQVEAFPSQFEEAISIAEKTIKNIDWIEKARKIKKIDSDKNLIEKLGLKGIVIAGMGGSAYPGEVLRDYFVFKRLKVPVFIVRDYSLPDFIDDNYLVFVQSYSGNTEETIGMFNDCMKKSIDPIVITSGGMLLELAKKNREPYILLPKDWQPRFALGYFLFVELRILSEIFPKIDLKEELKYLGFVKWNNYEEKGKSLAEKINEMPLLYSTPKLKAVVQIWKALFNECAKEHCFQNQLSELNHNEMVGFTLDTGFFVVVFQDETENYRMKKRISLLQDMFKKRKVKSLVLNLTGGTYLTRVLTLIYLGMWTAIYRAEKNGVDPEKVEIIEEFKKKLGKFI